MCVCVPHPPHPQVACEKTVSAMHHVLQRTIRCAKGMFRPGPWAREAAGAESEGRELEGQQLRPLVLAAATAAFARAGTCLRGASSGWELQGVTRAVRAQVGCGGTSG